MLEFEHVPEKKKKRLSLWLDFNPENVGLKLLCDNSAPHTSKSKDGVRRKRGEQRARFEYLIKPHLKRDVLVDFQLTLIEKLINSGYFVSELGLVWNHVQLKVTS